MTPEMEEMAVRRREAIACLLDMIDDLESTVSAHPNDYARVPNWLRIKLHDILEQNCVVNETYGISRA